MNHIGRIVLLTLFLASVSFAGKDKTVADSTLINFEIEDQFKKKHSDDDFHGNIILSTISDRKGSEYIKYWNKAIVDSLKAELEADKLRFMPVAHVKGVPFFIKGKIRSKMKEDKSGQPVLLDWKGRFYKAYKLAKDSCNILIFDKSGKVVYRSSGQELEIDKLNKLLELVRSKLD